MNALLCRSLASSFPPSSETPSSLALQATFRHLPGSSLRRRRSNQQFFSNSLSLLTVAPRLGQVMNINKNDYDSVAAQSSSSPSKGACAAIFIYFSFTSDLVQCMPLPSLFFIQCIISCTILNDFTISFTG